MYFSKGMLQRMNKLCFVWLFGWFYPEKSQILNDCLHLMCVDKAVSKPFFKPLNCPFPNSLVNPVQESETYAENHIGERNGLQTLFNHIWSTRPRRHHSLPKPVLLLLHFQESEVLYISCPCVNRSAFDDNWKQNYLSPLSSEFTVNFLD